MVQRPAGSLALCLGLTLLTPGSAQAWCTEGNGERGGGRPILSGPVQQWETDDGRFRLHWTEEGVDTPTNLQDADANGLPDFADRALDGLLRGDIEFPAAGYRPVPLDDGEGGSPAIDVYFRDIPANGYAFEVPAVEGTDAESSCVMQLDGGLGVSLDGVLESVAAHELHHCTQYAHTITAPSWLLESTATFEQYRMYRTIAMSTALSVLWRVRLREPERAIDSLGQRYEYAGFVFEHFWESFGMPFGEQATERLPALWEALREAQGDWEGALDAESRRLWDQPFAQTALDFATWNAFACDRSDAAHYPFDRFPCDIEASVPILPSDGATVAVSLDEPRFSSRYVGLPHMADPLPYELTCASIGDAGARARVRLLSLDGFGREVEVADTAVRDGEPFTLRLAGPLDPDGETLLVVVSTGTSPVQIDCDAERVPVLLDDSEPDPGEGCACAGSEDGSEVAVALLGLLALVGPKRRRRRGSPGAVC